MINENYLMAYGRARLAGAPDGVASKFARPFMAKVTSVVLSADVIDTLWNSMGWEPRHRKSATELKAEDLLAAKIAELTKEKVDA